MIANVITHEDDKTYHSRSKSGEMLSSHMLARFRNSPLKYHQTITGEHVDDDKPEFVLGRAAHCLILEGREAFNERYVVSDGPVNSRTGEHFGRNTKAFAEWAAVQTGEVVSSVEYDDIRMMCESCYTHAGIMELLTTEHPLRFAEGVVRADIEGVKCQIKMDYFAPEVGIIDLKTCRDIDFFDNDIRSFGYAYQLAFYQSVLEKATGIKYPVHVIAVDKTDYHIAGRWDFPDAELDQARYVNDAAIRRLKQCRETNEWPTGYERTRVFAMTREEKR